MASLANRAPVFDVLYDDAAQDWQIVGGDIVISSDPVEVFSNALKAAMETRWGSLKYILAFGNEGRDLSFMPFLGGDRDLTTREAKFYFGEIMGGLARLVKTVKAATFTFSKVADSFTVDLELVLSDIDSTLYVQQLQWDAVTKRATIS